MSNMNDEKEKAWDMVRLTTANMIFEEPTKLEEDYWKHGFDAGVKAERERVKNLISAWRSTCSSPVDIKISDRRLTELFPQEQEK